MKGNEENGEEGSERGQAKVPRDRERRAAQRVKTLRQALFSTLTSTEPLRQGRVVDISGAGLQIGTDTPEPVGTPVQIEIDPKQGEPSSSAMLVEGEVARVSELDDGEYAMGVRLLLDPLAKPAIQPHAPDRAHASPPHIVAPLPAAKGTAHGDSSESRNERPSTQGRKRPLRYLVPACLILGALAISLFWWRESITRLPVDGYGLGKPGLASANKEDDVSRNQIRGSGTPTGTPVGTATGPLAFASLEPHQLLERALARLASGLPEESEPLLEVLLAHPRATPMERFLAELGKAQAAMDQGNDAQAGAIVEGALAASDTVHPLWVETAQSLLAGLTDGQEPMGTVLPVTPAFTLSEIISPPTQADNVRVSISKQNYVLTIFVDEEPIRSFPIGLGRDDSTPTGSFHIANKITDPDWYNRGLIVKAGSPDNPLGKRWMGLGDGARATSYGIHPTNDPRSIGQPVSRGCIRMRPEDAETLFRVCPVGTPVVIQPGTNSG